MSQEVEQEYWLELEKLRRRALWACDHGQGSPALRAMAEALDAPQAALERERGRRQLFEAWYASDQA